ncbi:hypothetical protein HS125_05940 [bacterium]|nr:hypothetical protein [bacterium]
MALRQSVGGWRVGLCAAGFIALFVLQAGRPPAADVKLQDLIEGGGAPKVTGSVAAATSELKQVGFKIGGDRYRNNFDDERWRNECFAYQGMGHLDGKYLDFVYGGDDVIVFCLTAPQVKNGGKLKITALIAADPGDVEISTSADHRNYKRVAGISRLGTLEVDLPPSSGDEMYVMLDGRAGNGVVVDDLEITLSAEGPTPTPTPTPTQTPAVRDDRPGYQRTTPGTTRGERYEFDRRPPGTTTGPRDRTGITPPEK